MRALLIAGPLTLDADGLFAGDGVIAAAAAAPFSPTQLWAQGGTSIDHYRRGLLTKRGIDDAGIDWSGATPAATGPFLPAAEPTDAEGVGAALLISLAPDEHARARRVIAALPGAEARPLLVAPRPGDLADAATRNALIADTDLVIAPLAAAQREHADEIAVPADPRVQRRVVHAHGTRGVRAADRRHGRRYGGVGRRGNGVPLDHPSRVRRPTGSGGAF